MSDISCLDSANLLNNRFYFRHFLFGRYAGYTQGSSEYSVKSLTEREAAKLLSQTPGLHNSLYSPHHTSKHHNNSGIQPLHSLHCQKNAPTTSDPLSGRFNKLKNTLQCKNKRICKSFYKWISFTLFISPG